MAFYQFPCSMNDYWLLDNKLTNSLTLKASVNFRDGDIVRLDERDGEDRPTGASLLRQVIRTYMTHAFSRTFLILVPLDHPPLQQLELTNPQHGTFVCWVGSEDRFTVGSAIRLRNLPHRWEIAQTCTSVAATRLPEQARVGFLAKGGQ